jgi:soluble lytic murein transglycosylase-like protein
MTPNVVSAKRLDPNRILAALDATERSDSDDTSPKGAKGNFQLMDATGKEYHRRLGIAEPYNPRDDDQAKQIAGAFVSDLIRKYQDPDLVAAAYNMGETNLDRFIKQYGRSWAAIEPHLQGSFLETKKYVPFFRRALSA